MRTRILEGADENADAVRSEAERVVRGWIVAYAEALERCRAREEEVTCLAEALREWQVRIIRVIS